MAIPNPNPNIRDLEQVDNYTWSSNKIAESINDLVSYSTEETKIGSFDGEDLYKITIIADVFEMPANTNTTLINIADLNIDKLINASIICHLDRENGATVIDGNLKFLIYDTGDVVGVQSAVSVVTGINFKFYINLYYTKKQS